jgi:hypothetical protein
MFFSFMNLIRRKNFAVWVDSCVFGHLDSWGPFEEYFARADPLIMYQPVFVQYFTRATERMHIEASHAHFSSISCSSLFIFICLGIFYHDRIISNTANFVFWAAK